MGNCIYFANAILKTKKNLKANQECITAWGGGEMGSYDILTDISEHVTLVQLIYSFGIANHGISVIG